MGYDEILAFIVNSRGVLTDSGTVVEETCVLGIPSVQMRKSTERPQVYDARSSVKFDREIFHQLESLRGGEWRRASGDGKSSERIAQISCGGWRRTTSRDMVRRGIISP